MTKQLILPISPDPSTVALVLDDEGAVYDEAYCWEAAQNYALHEGREVIAVADDGFMSKEQIQALCDAERARYLDCFGGR